MATKKKAPLAGKAVKANLSGGSGQGGTGSDLKGGGGPGSSKVKKAATKKKK